MSRTSALRYGCALLAVTLASLAWHPAVRHVEPDPYLFLLAAVAITSWYGGVGPGIAATCLGAFIALLVSPETPHALSLVSVQNSSQIGLFVLVALVIGRLNGKLRRQLEFTGALIGNLGDGICVVDRRGRLSFMNTAAEAMLRWREGDLLDRNLHTVVHACSEDGPIETETPCSFQEALQKRELLRNEDATFRRKDGTTFPVAFTSSPILVHSHVVGTAIAFRNMTERHRAVQALRQSEERYRTMVETSPDSIWLTDLYGYVIMANERASSLFGYDNPSRMLELSALELVAADDRPQMVQEKRRTVEGGEVETVSYSLLRNDGTTFPAEVSTSLITDEKGRPKAFIHVGRDATPHKQVEERLLANEMSLSLEAAVTGVLVESAPLNETMPRLLAAIGEAGSWDVGTFWIVDTEERVLRCRATWHPPAIEVPGFEALNQQLALSPRIDLPGRVWSQHEPIWIPDVVADPDILRALMASKEGLRSAFCFPVVVAGTVQGVMEFFSCAVRQPDAPLMEAMAATGSQIGRFIERKQAERSLEHQALHDALTDLPNRVLLQDRLQRGLSFAHVSGKPLALLLVDLDRFKQVNDTFGHHYGDVLLQQAAGRLQGVLRESDTVARVGGDEFALILPGIGDVGAVTVADKILAALDRPFMVEGRRLDVGASVGVALFPHHAENAAELMQRADLTMYAAKRERAGYAVYSPEIERESTQLARR